MPLKLASTKSPNDPYLPRASVKAVYDQVIADLTKAAELMTESKNNNFASKEVAWALLSRVYLYKEDNAKAIEFANKVITSPRYALQQGDAYRNYFRGVPEDNKETIFCIRHIKTENRDFSAIGSMYYSEGGQGQTGWGEIYASKQFVDFLDQQPADMRHAFISPYTNAGPVLAWPYPVPAPNVRMNTRLVPNTPMYYINKYNYQEGLTNLSSPVYLRPGRDVPHPRGSLRQNRAGATGARRRERAAHPRRPQRRSIAYHRQHRPGR